MVPRHGFDRTALYRAKLSRPNLGSLVLDRVRLVQAVADQAERPLTLVIADAGYGKTTLLTSYAKSAGRPVVWYSLMPSDADVMVFCRYLLEGFRRESSKFGRSFRRLLEEEPRAGEPSAERLAGTLANDLADLRGRPYLLVLDDFHEVTASKAVLAIMDALIAQLPRTVRILIAARSVPPLALDRLRARGELGELDSSDLRLTGPELERLFSEVYRRPVTTDELQALESTTLGWPTAVHLVYESLRRDPQLRLEDVLARFRSSDLDLHDYLSSEVYARLDPASRRLLERTAALVRFDAGIAAALGEDRGAARTLEALSRRGLLRTFGGPEHASYECHDLVRRFVRQDLESRVGPEGLRQLEADTAHALEARGDPERALHHHLRAGSVADAARIVRELAPGFLRQGRALALLRHLDDLPAETVAGELALGLARADAQRATGAWDEARVSYQNVLDAARALADRERECQALAGLGRVLNSRGEHEQVLVLAESGLARARDLPVDIRARLLQIKAAAHFYLGHHQAAIKILAQVRSLLDASDDRELLLPTVHNLAMAYAAQGRYREASDELRVALAEVRGTSSPRAPLYLSNLAFLLSELGELPEARRAAEEGFAAAQRFANRAQMATCQQALAQILAQSGDLDGALGALRQAEELNAELRMEVVSAELLALRGRIFADRGEHRRAVAFLNEAIERYASRRDDPRQTELKATLAWCELRAGRARVAREILQSLLARVDADENDDRRMRVHYWLAEALLALGSAKQADAHLAVALRLVRERGYLHFLKVQAGKEAAPLLHALARGIEVTTVAAALADAGAAIEVALLGIAEKAPPAAAEIAVTLLSEVGGSASRERLEALGKSRRTLKPAIRTALKHVTERAARNDPATPRRAASARLILYGPPRLLVNGEPVPPSAWRAQRAFQVLVFLALHPRGANKDDLLERFWPGRQAAAGRKNFHPTLTYVRSVLPGTSVPAILREGEFYRLNPAYPLTCDAWDVERALAEARGSAPEARREALRLAISMALGPFLEGVYASWAAPLQAHARDRLESALIELGELSARAGDADEALERFRRAVEIDEYRESTRLAVVECLMILGRRRDALAECDKLERVLRAELGVDALPETRDDMNRLLRGEGVHDWPRAREPRTVEAKVAQPITASTQVPVKRRAVGSRT